MMANQYNIGLIVPRFEEFTDFYQAADRLGFHSLWATEMVFHSPRRWDPLPVLASVATTTSRIRLGTGVLWTSMRDPVAFAASAANLDSVSGGRLSVGISQQDWPGEARTSGSMWARQGGRLEEAITLLKRLWSEPDVTFQGNHFRLERASISSRPVQPGGIPILVGGTSLATVRLAATLANAWVHPSGGIPEEMPRYCQAIRALASQAGQDPDSLELGKIIYLAIDDDKARARARLFPLQQFYGARYNLDRWCAFGPPDECAAFIQRVLDAGINSVLLGLPRPDVDELERIHREVVPLLK